ncbi:hypothetical protein PP182_17715 [Maribacter sp. PR1]|uniref:Uncharacterized protein n=1 Tax=Maribacter cobaltidurans TaxID=1178778 RepID=A0ABU7IYQ8_9FLAO|nr:MULTISPECIES: hypothetical protein [Maribacter]MDC6390531.1 hypothetical protein [Maribacter sp. PR1]MEE1977921.1 hypothetical protein [Maribacter cobaltidurans]
MKKYEVYKNIRKRAILMGLPINLFVLMMVSVIGSLLVIIFSFSLTMIISLLVLNTVLYSVLTYMAKSARTPSLPKVFPTSISNKKIGLSSYAENQS